MQEKNIFIVMTSSMTSQSDLKVVSLYSFMNDKITFFMITEERTNKDIIFKLSVHMYHWNVNMRLQAILEYFVDDVIRSQNKSKLWTTIALSKFELEKRSTAQNVANWTGYQKFKFQFHIQISKVWQVSNLRLPFHVSVCLSAWTLWTRYRSHRLTNHHQTLHKYGLLVRTEAYSFSRSKVQ